MFKLEFTTSNAAFNDPFTGEENKADKANETVRIINRISKEISIGKTSGVVMDINGNKIGEWELN